MEKTNKNRRLKKINPMGIFAVLCWGILSLSFIFMENNVSAVSIQSHEKSAVSIPSAEKQAVSIPSVETSMEKTVVSDEKTIDVPMDDRKNYMTTDKAFYPYSPSLIQWERSRGDFTAPETCAECHPEKYEEWQGSMHAMAFQDPVYQGELNHAVHSVGTAVSRQCEGCHTPAAVLKKEVKGAGLKGLSDIALAGVSCDVCHSVKDHTHWQTPSCQPENGSLVFSPAENVDGSPGEKASEGTASSVNENSGVESEDFVLTKYGPVVSDEWCGDEFHVCKESPIHRSSELCAACHQVTNYKIHTALEETYREWKNGPYATNNIHCQDCHMVDTETFKKVADTFEKPAREDYHHYFNGANFLIYNLTRLAALKSGNEDLAANADEKYKMAVARLESAAELEIAPVYRDEKLAEIRVRVNNIRAGHNLTTSLTNIRQMWLEVTATDPEGRVLMQTGTVGAKGALPENIRMFNSQVQDRDLKFTINPWEAESFSKNDTIPPKGYKDVYYGLSNPKGEPITVKATLRYRQADQAVAEKLLKMVPDDVDLEAIYGIKEIPVLPIIDMAVKTVVLK